MRCSVGTLDALADRLVARQTLRVNEQPSSYSLRPATERDADFLAEMTLEAFNWDPDRPPLTMRQLRADPTLWKYLDGWPAAGEQGVIAAAGSGELAGAAWWRFFTAATPGYGFVSEDVPELGLAVAANWRGRGVGRALLRGLLDQARAAGLERISLSVERANHAAALYAAEGFETVGGDENADTMVKRL